MSRRPEEVLGWTNHQAPALWENVPAIDVLILVRYAFQFGLQVVPEREAMSLLISETDGFYPIIPSGEHRHCTGYVSFSQAFMNGEMEFDLRKLQDRTHSLLSNWMNEEGQYAPQSDFSEIVTFIPLRHLDKELWADVQMSPSQAVRCREYAEYLAEQKERDESPVKQTETKTNPENAVQRKPWQL